MMMTTRPTPSLWSGLFLLNLIGPSILLGANLLLTPLCLAHALPLLFLFVMTILTFDSPTWTWSCCFILSCHLSCASFIVVRHSSDFHTFLPHALSDKTHAHRLQNEFLK